MFRSRVLAGAVLTLLFALAAAPNAAQAADILVPQDVGTIQGAIDLAVNGDTVRVAPGTYVENINFLGKAITVTSVDGPATTIIDGGAIDSVVIFSSGEGPASVIRGFTIRNGAGASLWAGGVTILSSSPTVENNKIVDNVGCEGIGVTIRFGSAIIKGNEIRGNIQNGCSTGGGGGGILVGGAASAQILDNVISDNVLRFNHGGGIYVASAGTPVIRGNIIRNNSTSGTGGGISLTGGSDALMVQNVIVGNSASVKGGGIAWGVPFGTVGPLLVNNTIADNSAPEGSAIFADAFDAQARLVNNNIIAAPGQTALFCGDFNDLNPPILEHNNIFSAGGDAYGGICADETGFNGNISGDPEFVDPSNGDYSLQSNSSSVDAGDGTAPELPSTDFQGLPRPFDGDGDSVATVDIGAFEFQSDPVAHAGFDQTVGEADTTFLDGTGSFDPDGGALGYQWFLDGVEIAMGPTAVIGPFPVGIYTASLTVTDIDGNSASHSVLLRVNQPPVADAGPDQTAMDVETVTLSGLGSFDPDGSIVSYSWSLDGVPISTEPNPTVGPFEAGTHIVTLTVTDMDGASGSDSLLLTVLPTPPVANAGPDRTIRVTQTVTFDGTGSVDPNGGPLTYSWTLGGVEIATGATPTVGSFDVGTHEITLTVTDESGLTGSDAMILYVLPPNQAPVADAGPDQTVIDVVKVWLDGSGSLDPDGGIASYSWSLDGVQLASGWSVLVGPFAVGTYAVTLTVIDFEGASASDSLVLTVIPSPPVAFAGLDQSIRVTQTATLDGTVSFDPNGGPLTYSWTFGGVEVASEATTTVGPFDIGTYEFTLTVTDVDGLTDSDTMFLTVLPPNEQPVADAGADQTVVDSEFAALNGSGSSDPDGSFLSYAWSLGGTVIATGVTPTLAPLAVGSYTITLTVTDADGATASDEMVLLVHLPPLADAGPDQTVTEADMVTFDGSASFDPDAGPLTYAWRLNGTIIAVGAVATAGPLEIGLRVIELTVTDQEGVTDSDTVTIAVTAADQERVVVPGAIRVPFDYATIQAAVDVAIDGDTVLVSPGDYFETINFLGKAITLISEFGPDVTTIDGGAIDSIVIFVTGEGPASEIRGFTLRNGRASVGAGIILSASSPTIIANIFDSNKQDNGGFGAGIGGYGSSPIIENNIFRNNTCDSQHLSGVVSFITTSSPRIINNIFENNPCRAINMTLPEGSQPIVVNNTIVGNKVGIRVDRRLNSTSQIFENNIIVQNGIGLEIEFGIEDYNPIWRHNLVFDNWKDYDVILDQTGVNGNISTDPLFVDAVNGDYRLQAVSPAIEAGDASAPALPLADLDGNGRVVDGDGDGIAAVDIGAYEFGAGAVANAGPDQTVTDRDLVALDGAGSFDPDGGVLTYDWSLDGVTLSTGPNVTVGPFAAGSHEILLSVTDAAGVVSADTLTLTVLAVNQPPVAGAGPDLTIQTLETAVLDGSGSSDPEGDALTYAWSLDGVQVGTGPAPTVGPFDDGVHTITLTVTDSFGASASDSMVLTVLNRPPVADAGPDQTVAPSKGKAASVTLDGTASLDPDGGLVSYVWTRDGQTVGSTATLQLDLKRGTYTFTLTVTDDDGASASDTTVVTVTRSGGTG